MKRRDIYAARYRMDAVACSGECLIANLGTDCLDIASRDGDLRVLADSIDGQPLRNVKFHPPGFARPQSSNDLNEIHRDYEGIG